MTYFKVLSHDLRPPLQGGEPLALDKLPFTTEAVELDTSAQACAPGWHFVSDLATGFRIVGLWPNGHPARAFEVEPSQDVLERGDKHRASQITFLSELDHDGIEAGVFDLSKPFGRFRKDMTDEQMAWYTALGRPENDPERVEHGLRAALKIRGLDWELKCFDDLWDAWDARDARAAWDARDAWAAWDARDARDALSVFYASSNGWVDHSALLLTTGLRDAYHAGLGIALPIGGNELGWAMDEIAVPAKGEAKS